MTARLPAQSKHNTGDPLGQWAAAPAEWPERALWDLAQYINGRAFKPTDFSKVGLPVIKITELKYGLSDSTACFEGAFEAKHLLRKTDLLFAWSGNPETSLDAFWWRYGNALLNQHIFRVIPHDRIDKTFLFYLLKFLRPTFIRTARDKATSMGHVKVSDLKRLIGRIPSPPEQRSIAHILGALDDKMELNRRMNETLEAMARAIFRSWFLDFDPVRAKADDQQPFGMDAETASLFPNSFDDSALGKTPKHWNVVPLPQAFHVNPPRSLAKGHEATYLDMRNMPTQGHRPLGWTRRPFVSGSRFTNGDTLIARITPCLENGKTAYVDFLRDGEIGWGSTEFIVLQPHEPLPPEYGYCLARTDEFRDFAIQNMTGSSGRQRVPTDCFRGYPVVIPSEPVARRFGQLVRPLFARVKANSEETANLAAIRDALLPKLISGEIRVPLFHPAEMASS